MGPECARASTTPPAVQRRRFTSSAPPSPRFERSPNSPAGSVRRSPRHAATCKKSERIAEGAGYTAAAVTLAKTRHELVDTAHWSGGPRRGLP
ncbi:hypothetical protein DSL92_06675 [Billgrantia gudaonensis]|uniref:Uncharacterized protein n=1 Tax=Billgrantia gudaonensis TaxID=376427 RepID=A0A3S0NH62_9GAMM|nr:hypothetical protein DSL92_06675 [Halomonas gudaonensis]